MQPDAVRADPSMQPARAKLRTLSAEEGLVATIFLGMTALACLMPIHNDTWWHLRNGQEMFRTHSPLFEDRFSFTEHGAFFWNHSWLAQLLFYPIYAAGGPVLLTAFCAVVVSTGWILSWRLMRGDIAIKVVLFAIALSIGTTIWSLRPQVFSIGLLPIVTRLAMADRWVLIVPLIILWTNLHAGVAMGLAVLVGAVIAAMITDRSKLRARLVGTGLAAAGTLLNPVGITAWLELVRSMARSRANLIEEWMAPSFRDANVIFWFMAAAFVWQLLRRWRHLTSSEDRVLAIAALAALPVAARTLRNVPAFAMLAAPALSRLLTASTRRREAQRSPSAGSPIATSLAGLTAAIAITGVAVAWQTRWARLGWDPISPSAAAAITSCPGPLYNPYEAGGSIIWFAPSQPVFLDSRQDQFPTSLVQEATRVEATGDYHQLFDRYGFNCAAVRPGSAIARALGQSGWKIAFSDPKWIVLTRPR